MSWLSKAIGNIPVVGNAINAVAKPIQSVARGVLGSTPLGAAALGAGDALGRAIPTPGVPGVLAGALGAAGVGSGGGSSVSPAVMALAAAQAANSASSGKQANDYSDKAWNLANDSYTSRAGLRDLGIKGLTNNKAPDLSSLSSIRAQNPVAARAGVSGAPSAPLAPPTTPPMGGGLPLAPPAMRSDVTPSMQQLPEGPSIPDTTFPTRQVSSGGMGSPGLRAALSHRPGTAGIYQNDSAMRAV